MAGSPNKSKIQRPIFEKFLPYLLFIFAGYCIADIAILSYRDLMLPTQPPPARPKKSAGNEMANRGAYNTVINRNMFSSDGIIPDQLVAAGEKKQERPEDAAPVQSSLPIGLMGTIVHSNPAKSIATIQLKAKNQTLPYSVGREIENFAKLEKVERTKIIIRNLNNNRLEFVEMKIDGGKISFGASKPAAPAASNDVVQAAPNKFEINRADVLKYTNDMASVLQQAAMAPRRGANGEIECFKFLSIQPGSIYTRLGFQNGDCLKAVNGEKIDSPAKAMEMYNALKQSNSINLSFERDGKDTENGYNIK